MHLKDLFQPTFSRKKWDNTRQIRVSVELYTRYQEDTVVFLQFHISWRFSPFSNTFLKIAFLKTFGD